MCYSNAVTIYPFIAVTTLYLQKCIIVPLLQILAGNVGDEFGDRIKTYEERNRLFLQNRIPVIIRIDGRSFHEFYTDGQEQGSDRS
jgi:hypothetical protein